LLTGSFTLLENGVASGPATTFSEQPQIFENATWTRAQIYVQGNEGVIVTDTTNPGAYLPGDTLTANAVTNDADATLSYKWERSKDGFVSDIENIGSNSSSYHIQGNDTGYQIRVVSRPLTPTTRPTLRPAARLRPCH
jgi:hypothetical protein